MIRIVVVRGDVLVDDASSHYSQMATAGLELPTSGNYLIATTQNSSATLLLNGKAFNLGPNSFMRVRGDLTWWARHQQYWSRDVRLFVGQLWAKIAKDPREEHTANAAVGVRG